jgi:hypothetical protein
LASPDPYLIKIKNPWADAQGFWRLGGLRGNDGTGRVGERGKKEHLKILDKEHI